MTSNNKKIEIIVHKLEEDIKIIMSEMSSETYKNVKFEHNVCMYLSEFQNKCLCKLQNTKEEENKCYYEKIQKIIKSITDVYCAIHNDNKHNFSKMFEIKKKEKMISAFMSMDKFMSDEMLETIGENMTYDMLMIIRQHNMSTETL